MQSRQVRRNLHALKRLFCAAVSASGSCKTTDGHEYHHIMADCVSIEGLALYLPTTWMTCKALKDSFHHGRKVGDLITLRIRSIALRYLIDWSCVYIYIAKQCYALLGTVVPCKAQSLDKGFAC